jgi:hypothetical protein
MKHVGKMKNNNAKIAVAYRTLPGDPDSALVIGTNVLGEAYHNALMNLIEDNSAQQANELADILAVRKFPDGSNMLEWLHTRGHLKKVSTNMVLMTPSTQASIQLDELNKLIAEQRGVSVDQLAITDGNAPKAKPVVEEAKPIRVEEPVKEMVQMTPAEMRTKADSLSKEAQKLRKKANELDPLPSTKKAQSVK